MKCIMHLKTGTITKVSDSCAELRVSEGIHTFCPKHLWKERVRDIKPYSKKGGKGVKEKTKTKKKKH